MKKFSFAKLGLIAVLALSVSTGFARNPLPPDTVFQGVYNKNPINSTITNYGLVVNSGTLVSGSGSVTDLSKGTLILPGSAVISGTTAGIVVSGTQTGATLINPTLSGTVAGNTVKTGTATGGTEVTTTLTSPTVGGTITVTSTAAGVAFGTGTSAFTIPIVISGTTYHILVQ